MIVTIYLTKRDMQLLLYSQASLIPRLRLAFHRLQYAEFFVCTRGEPVNEDTGKLLLYKHILNSSRICIGCMNVPL